MTKEYDTTKPHAKDTGAECEAARLGRELAEVWRMIEFLDQKSKPFSKDEPCMKSGACVSAAAEHAETYLGDRSETLFNMFADVDATSAEGALAQMIIAAHIARAAVSTAESDPRQERDERLSERLADRVIGYLERHAGKTSADLGLQMFILPITSEADLREIEEIYNNSEAEAA